MGFRDEEDALRAKTDALEAELARKDRELQDKERELLAMQRKLDGADDEPPQGPPPAALRPAALDVEIPRPPLWTRAWRWMADVYEEIGLAGLFGIVVGGGGMLVGVTAAYQSCTVTHVPDSGAPGLVYVEVVRQGSVASIEGSAPVASGAACIVTVTTQEDEQMNCRASVHCGDVPLYGMNAGTGFLHCTIAPDKTPTAGIDGYTSAEDRDPELILDLTHGRVEVRDGVGPSAWGVVIRLGEGTVERVGMP